MSEEDLLSVSTPAARLLGRRVVSADRATGRVELEFEAREEFRNRRGDVQGGILAAMLDSTVGLSLVAASGESGVTLEMKTNFLRPAGIGKIFGSGRLVHRGRSIAFVEGELRNAAGEVLATATATMRLLHGER
jgi:uncharacterized protein (TIGR00369 family)